MNLRRLILAFALAMGGPFAFGQALQGTEFTFQGNLTQNGTPLTGTPNLEFRLFDSLGTQIGPTLGKPTWPVSDGAFTVELDFSAVFNGQQRFLEITVNGTVLAPRIPISNAPYALASQYAMPDSVLGSSIVDNTIGAADVKATQLQLRVTGACAAGEAIRSIDTSGGVVCETAGAGGDITGVTTAVGSGLAGGVASGEANLSIPALAVTSARLADAAVTTQKLADNAVTLQKLSGNSVGTANIVDGAILTADIALQQITSDRIAPLAIGTQQIDSSQVQRRVSTGCPAGSALRAIDASGLGPTCESVGGTDWSRSGNAGTDPASNYLGTSDNQALELRAANRRVLRLQPIMDPADGDAPSVVAGSAANTVGGAGGATVAGGGATLYVGAPCPACRNAATAAFATVSGGKQNQSTAPFATVAGGFGNVAGGNQASVGGGITNTASGQDAVVPGGYSNCAGGNFSFAAGALAKVRPPAGSNSCAGVANAPTAGGDQGTFVWADSINANFVSSGPDQFLVRASGGAGINTSVPRAPLDVQAGTTGLGVSPDPGTVLLAEKATGNSFITILGAAGAQRGLIFGEPGSVADGGIFYDNNAGNAMEFRTNGNVTRATIDSAGNLVVGAGAYKPGGGSWSAVSDGRLKKNVVPLEHALDRLLALRGVSFEYGQPDAVLRPSGVHIGFVAQEVQSVFPRWVAAGPDGFLTVGPQGFEALAVEALRDLKASQDVEVEALRADNRELRGELADLRRVVGAMRAERHGEQPER